jgi:hypothetical protein
MDNFTIPKKVLDERFHGRRNEERPKLGREDNMRLEFCLVLSRRGWRRLVRGGGISESELLKVRAVVPHHNNNMSTYVE